MKLIAKRTNTQFPTVLEKICEFYGISKVPDLVWSLHAPHGIPLNRVILTIGGLHNFSIPVGFWLDINLGDDHFETQVFEEIIGRVLVSFTDPFRSCEFNWAEIEPE